MGGAGPADYSGAPSKKTTNTNWNNITRSEEHTSELQSPCNLVCRLLLEKKKRNQTLAAVLYHLSQKQKLICIGSYDTTSRIYYSSSSTWQHQLTLTWSIRHPSISHLYI